MATIAQVQAELEVLNAAYLRLATGVSSYNINLGGTARTLTRMNLTQLRKEIKYKENQLQGLQNAGSNGVFGLPTKYGTPVDDR